MALFKREISEASQDILKKSIDFESNTIFQVKRSERLAWIVTFCSMAVTVCLVAAIAFMLPLKEKVPYLVTVDLKRSTSTVTHLRDDVAYSGIYASEALNRSYVARFVQAREGYDWDTINEHDWEFVASMSNDQVKSLFVKQFDGSAQSPEKRWGRNAAIRVKVNSIVFHGMDEERRKPPVGATVRFEKWKFDKASGRSEYLSSHVGTMNYEYKTNLRMSDSLRLRNPLGFQVTAFRVDDEFNAPVFKSQEMEGGIPLLEEGEGMSFRGADAAATTLPATARQEVPQIGLPGAPSTPTTQ
ncbi:virB8 family protein [Hydrogenophaga sp.]|uniref:virB8 family protein n=1 Tax=Hydrogenophaga sp. TaxID=1904254 RepID=UPI0027163C28|nr:type IV secretion system protein [Hydrogenophaga sp.]MDO8906034.1 type IV secretion system protein [Hydrogenophaga sp.]